MTSIELAIKEENSDLLMRAAHTIKSSSQQLGALELAQRFFELEKAGKENKFDNSYKIFEEAKILYEKVRKSLLYSL